MNSDERKAMEAAAEWCLRRYHHPLCDTYDDEPCDCGLAATLSLLRSALARETTQPLTFSDFRIANVWRCLKWHPQGINSWSSSDWLTAVVGEVGELASLLKMRNRERDGLPGNKFSPSQKQIADELADVFTYLDLLATSLGVDLDTAVVQKFNEVSERVGFPDRIPAPQPVPPSGEQRCRGCDRLIPDICHECQIGLTQGAEDVKAGRLHNHDDVATELCPPDATGLETVATAGGNSEGAAAPSPSSVGEAEPTFTGSNPVKFHARILTDEEFAKITQPLKAEQPCLFCGKTYAEHADTDQGTRSYLGCRGWKGGFVKSNQPAAVPERDAEARLIDIEERANKATPGPWDYRIFNDGYSVEQQLDVQQIVLTCGLKNGADNSAFIAHARTDVPWLVSELRRVAAARKEGE